MLLGGRKKAVMMLGDSINIEVLDRASEFAKCISLRGGGSLGELVPCYTYNAIVWPMHSLATAQVPQKCFHIHSHYLEGYTNSIPTLVHSLSSPFKIGNLLSQVILFKLGRQSFLFFRSS